MNVVNTTKWIFPSSIFLLIFVSRVRSTITKTTNLRNAQEEIELSGNYSIPGTTLSPSLNPERQSFLQLSTYKPMKQVKANPFEMGGSRFRRQLEKTKICLDEGISRRCRHKCRSKCQRNPCQEPCPTFSPCCVNSDPKMPSTGESNTYLTNSDNCRRILKRCAEM
ncbi:uncharacterized protein LOC143452288 [Clavelina lepadiformis]|uniref:uncharacterized protein LOC143452288 n=1 Tax=Clavelina lepadiformis TaxID=159417 RepID=UPI00404369F7